MKKIAVLGSTGSIGKTALKIIERNSDEYKVVLLANDSSDEIFSQAKKFDVMNVFSRKGILIKDGKESSFYKDFLARPETYENVDIVINGIVGLAGLAPTLAVIEAGKILATANKESIVCAGNLINKKIINSKTIIRPVDSEHSTVWQCLEDKNDVKRIILTASGGAFRDFSEDRLAPLTH